VQTNPTTQKPFNDSFSTGVPIFHIHKKRYRKTKARTNRHLFVPTGLNGQLSLKPEDKVTQPPAATPES
jgi:hypothetical protein